MHMVIDEIFFLVRIWVIVKGKGERRGEEMTKVKNRFRFRFKVRARARLKVEVRVWVRQ